MTQDQGTAASEKPDLATRTAHFGMGCLFDGCVGLALPIVALIAIIGVGVWQI